MYGKFLVEGDKLVRELLTSNFKIDAIYAVNSKQYSRNNKPVELIDVSEAELKKISTHENPNQAVAVAEIPNSQFQASNFKLGVELVICCDSLNDPGNAGTVIRTADWFGIEKVFFSQNSVDIYNPKTVSATMGSLFRVKCFYMDLKELFEANNHLSVYGTFMKGDNIYKTELSKSGFIVVGNEANGISNELLPSITQKISIPSFGKGESLNAAVAAAIVMSEFRRES